MKKIIVSKKYDNKQLNSFILNEFPNLNRNALFKALRKKDIRINDIKVSKSQIIHEGDEITIYITDYDLEGKNLDFNVDVIYEDDNILVVNKPDNLSVTENPNDKSNLTSILKEKYGNNINPCHRIDRNTKGLVLFAKNDDALSILLDKFKNEEIEKHYLAKVYGIPPKKHDILEAYLFKDSKNSKVYISDTPKSRYQKIITEYSILKVDKDLNTSQLEINLHTGRTHQIRAHLAHIGYPILGDGKYGINRINKQFGYKTQELYSYKLKFNFKTDSSILNYLKGMSFRIKFGKEFGDSLWGRFLK